MLPPRVPESQYIQDCLLRLDSRIRINKDIIGPKQEINFINRTGQNLRVNISVEEMMPAEYLKKEFDRWKLDESRGFRDAASHYSHARVGSTSHSKAREAETLASPEQYSVGSSLIRSQVPVERNFQQPFKQDDTERRYHSSSVSAQPTLSKYRKDQQTNNIERMIRENNMQMQGSKSMIIKKNKTNEMTSKESLLGNNSQHHLDTINESPGGKFRNNDTDSFEIQKLQQSIQRDNHRKETDHVSISSMLQNEQYIQKKKQQLEELKGKDITVSHFYSKDIRFGVDRDDLKDRKSKQTQHGRGTNTQANNDQIVQQDEGIDHSYEDSSKKDEQIMHKVDLFANKQGSTKKVLPATDYKTTPEKAIKIQEGQRKELRESVLDSDQHSSTIREQLHSLGSFQLSKSPMLSEKRKQKDIEDGIIFKDKSKKVTWQIEDPNRMERSMNQEIVRTYGQMMRQKAKFHKIRQESRSKDRIHERLRNESREKIRKLEEEQRKRTKKADDLFTEHKRRYLEQLQLKNSRPLSNYVIAQPKESKATNRICNMAKSSMDFPKKSRSKSTNRSLSPQAEQVTRRLFPDNSQEKPLCKYYLKYYEQSERDNFDKFVKQSSFVCKYLSQLQLQQLFRKLHKERLPLQAWPAKIVNKAYQKVHMTSRVAYNKIKTQSGY